MTVTTTLDRQYFPGDGSNKNFPFNFKFFDNSQIYVYLIDATGDAVGKILNIDYTLSGALSPSGGMVVMSVAPPTGYRLLVRRILSQTQPTSIRNQGAFFPAIHEDVFDRLTMLIQQAISGLNGALQLDLAGESWDFLGKRGINVADPINPQDAATKIWAQTYIGSILETGQGPANNAANVIYVKPSGVPGVVQDLSSPDGFDFIGATLPVGGTVTIKGYLEWLISKSTLSVSGSADIIAAIAAGGEVSIANGQHYMMAPAVCDYAAPPEVGFAGNPSKRYDISGKTPGGTILSNQHGDYAIKLLGSIPITQNFGGFDRIGNLTIVGPNVTVPNTDNSGGLGLFVQTKAYTTIYNYAAFNLRLGLHLDGVLTSTVQDVTLDGCFEGMRVNDSNVTAGPNAMNFRRIKIGGTTSNGARFELGSSTQFDNLTIEGCGTMGGIAVGSLWQSVAGSIAVSVTLNSPYYELNAGPADIYISHTATQDMIMNINGGLLHRSTSARYVDTNLLVRSEAGAGKVTVKLRGVKFHGSFGYVPLSTRPYFDVGARCEVIWDDACQFSEFTSMNYWLCLDRDYSFVVSAAGAILSGPDGFSCTKVSTGVYRFARTTGKAEFAKNANDYSVIISTQAPAPNGTLTARTTTTFDVTTDNGTTVIDSPFSVTIKRIAGYYP